MVGLPVMDFNVSNGKLNFEEGTMLGVERLCSSIEVVVVQNGELHK